MFSHQEMCYWPAKTKLAEVHLKWKLVKWTRTLWRNETDDGQYRLNEASKTFVHFEERQQLHAPIQKSHQLFGGKSLHFKCMEFRATKSLHNGISKHCKSPLKTHQDLSLFHEITWAAPGLRANMHTKSYRISFPWQGEY